MADELNISAQFNFAKDNATLNAVVQNVLTVTNKNYADVTMDVPHSTTTSLVYGDVDPALLGLIIVQNIGDQPVGIRVDAQGQSYWRLPAGTATEPGGLFVAYSNSSDVGDLDIKFEVLDGITTSSRVTVRMIEI